MSVAAELKKHRMTTKAKVKATGKPEVRAPSKFKAVEPVNVATILEPEEAFAEGDASKKSVSLFLHNLCSFFSSLDFLTFVDFGMPWRAS